jgi:cation diffusion facilitator CzcD-associated flavoprotein CzcO
MTQFSLAKRAGRIRSVAIIGAGPSGVAVAKALVEEKAFDRIDVYDQRPVAGGLW